MIQIEKLCKQYGAARVVDDVSMVIEPRTITTIVGTSGSGKSTLLRMINRLIEPSSGRVLIDGNDTTAEPAHLLRRRIGYAIQGLGLFPHRTIAENIATVPRLLGWPQATFASKIEIDGDSATVTREVDGGLEKIAVKMPCVITVDLRLNEPRYASLPNIMKAKKKPIDQIALADLGVDPAPRLKVLKVAEPPARGGGIKVETAAELVDKLKNAAGVI